MISLRFTPLLQDLWVLISDIAYIRNQAKESIKEYATEHLPEQYQVCLTALDEIIKRSASIPSTDLQ
jgi:hypothetical protein